MPLKSPLDLGVMPEKAGAARRVVDAEMPTDGRDPVSVSNALSPLSDRASSSSSCCPRPPALQQNNANKQRGSVIELFPPFLAWGPQPRGYPSEMCITKHDLINSDTGCTRDH